MKISDIVGKTVITIARDKTGWVIIFSDGSKLLFHHEESPFYDLHGKLMENDITKLSLTEFMDLL